MKTAAASNGTTATTSTAPSTAPMMFSPASALTTALTALSDSLSEATALMTCEICDLTGGPFPAAEAAHLKAIHDRLHHGWSLPTAA